MSPAQEVLVADSNHHRIARFAFTGEFMCSFGSQGNGEGQFVSPSDVAWGNVFGTLVVADQGNQRVVLFDPLGLVRGVANGASSGLSSPRSVASATDGTRQLVYVADGSNRVVQIESPVPSPVDVWDQMKTHVAAGRTEDALDLFADAVRGKYRALFCYAGDSLFTLVSGLPDLSPVSIRGPRAQYRFEKEVEIEGLRSVVPFFIYFERNGDDEWRIRDF